MHNLTSNHVTRLDLGGKLLTNYLKDLISYKYLDLKRLFFQTQHVKHSLLAHQPKESNSATAYVFGDRLDTGYIETSQQALLQIPPSNKITFDQEAAFMKNLFFCPQHLGIQQGGLHQAILQTVSQMPAHLHNAFYSNLQLTGGNFNIPGLEGRLQSELREILPSSSPIGSTFSPDSAVLDGLSLLADQPERYGDMSITKADYYELGAYRVMKIFQFI